MRAKERGLQSAGVLVSEGVIGILWARLYGAHVPAGYATVTASARHPGDSADERACRAGENAICPDFIPYSDFETVNSEREDRDEFGLPTLVRRLP